MAERRDTPLPKTPEELHTLLESARLDGALKAIGALANAISQPLTAAVGHMELYQLGRAGSLPSMIEGITNCLNTLDAWRIAVRHKRIRFEQNEVGIDTVVIVPEENQPPR